jgi:hypothetical protein
MTARTNDQTIAALIAAQAAHDAEQAAQYQEEREQGQREEAERFCANLRGALGDDLYDLLGVVGVPGEYSPSARFTYQGHEFAIRQVSDFSHRSYHLYGPFSMRDDNAGGTYEVRRSLLRFLAQLPEAEQRDKDHPAPPPQTEDPKLEPTPEYLSVEDTLHDEGREMHVFVGPRDADGELDRFSGVIVEATETWLLVRAKTGGQRLIPVANVAYIAPGLKPAK